MEQLPLVFNQSEIEPDIQECFTPAFNFSKLNSSNGRLAFTADKIYWLPDDPMAMLDQGWSIKPSEIDSCSKYGISGFSIKLVDGKELRFSNVGSKMREEITAAIQWHKENAPAEEVAPVAAEAPADASVPVAAEAPAQEAKANEEAAGAPQDGPDPADAASNKWMAVLSYLGILVLIPLFAAKESKFARFHVNQGLILLILSVVIYFIGKIPGLDSIVWLLNLAIFLFAVIGIINAFKGETKELPLIGKFRIIS